MNTYHTEKQGMYHTVSFAELSLHIWCHKHKMANDQKLALLQKPGHEFGKGHVFIFQVYNKRRKMEGKSFLTRFISNNFSKMGT